MKKRSEVRPRSTALEKSERSDSRLTTTADLDGAAQRINELHAMGVAARSIAGHELLRVQRLGLYKLRTKGDGTAAFKSFGQWVAAETDVSRSTAFDMMKTARTFDVETIERFDKSILSLVQRMPTEQHGKLLADVERNGLTTRALAEKIGKAPKKPRAAKATIVAPEPKADEVTICMTKRRHEVPLYRKPATEGAFVSSADLKRATLTKHQPWGHCELGNEVTLSVCVRPGKDGNLVAFVFFERDGDATP